MIQKIFVRSWGDCNSKVNVAINILVQGGLGIPCILKANMIAKETNKRILTHYLELVKQNYKDISPEKEIIVGSFLESEKRQKTGASNSK